LKAALGGVFFTLFVLVFGSLIPAMVLHALIDASSGVIAWLVLRDEPVNGEFAGAGESP
jgi:membrane protease YdiL (CAAX protease family)